jgi:hypothetical protein
VIAVLLVQGERKNRHSLLSPESESTLENLLVQRPEGPFSLQVVLPPSADIAHTEQVPATIIVPVVVLLLV